MYISRKHKSFSMLFMSTTIFVKEYISALLKSRRYSSGNLEGERVKKKGHHKFGRTTFRTTPLRHLAGYACCYMCQSLHNTIKSCNTIILTQTNIYFFAYLFSIKCSTFDEINLWRPFFLSRSPSKLPELYEIQVLN